MAAAPRKSVTKETGNGSDHSMEFTHDQELSALRDMLLIRRFEEKAGQLYGMGAIGGFCHLYIGQEAIVVGMQMALKKGDQVITGYRDHGHMLACGMDAKGVMAELTGRRGGYSKGKGGSMHMFSKEKNFFGGHGIVGAQVSLGTGLAFANRYRGNDFVSLAYFGDGASNQGQVYESFNMAELWKLPVIYVIENNRYAMGTSVTRSSAQTDFSKRGISFNIPGEQVDGMDVRAVKAAGDKAVAWCRAGKGPYILEMQTYRYRGHSMSDPAKYRTREEVDKVRHDQDPIEQVRNRLLAAKMSEQELKAIDGEVREIVNAAADFAQHDPEPDASELYTDVYRWILRAHSSLKTEFSGATMPIQVLMPALSPTMEKGNLSKWLKKEGEAIKSGDVIAEIETDKATMEVEATDEGTLGKILIPEGTADVAVNTPIATILADGEDASDLGKASAPARQEKAAESAPPAAEAKSSPAPKPEPAPGRAKDRSRAGSRGAGGHRNGDDDDPGSLARRHGRGDATRPRCVRHGRGGCGISGRLQGDAGTAAGVRRQTRDRYADH